MKDKDSFLILLIVFLFTVASVTVFLGFSHFGFLKSLAEGGQFITVASTTGQEEPEQEGVSKTTLVLGDIAVKDTEPEPTPAPSPVPALPTRDYVFVNHNVPFVPQAPFGQWEDIVFDGACEEASITMVLGWLGGTATTEAEAGPIFHELADFQQENYGHFYDSSAVDTFRLMQDYHGMQNVELRYDITLQDIIAELKAGNVMIVQVNGQVLANPHYSSPGPLRHTLVVTGYDEEAGKIITNDPGTKFGDGWRYSADLFGRALQDYPSGYLEPLEGIRSSMIVVYGN